MAGLLGPAPSARPGSRGETAGAKRIHDMGRPAVVLTQRKWILSLIKFRIKIARGIVKHGKFWTLINQELDRNAKDDVGGNESPSLLFRIQIMWASPSLWAPAGMWGVYTIRKATCRPTAHWRRSNEINTFVCVTGPAHVKLTRTKGRAPGSNKSWGNGVCALAYFLYIYKQRRLLVERNDGMIVDNTDRCRRKSLESCRCGRGRRTGLRWRPSNSEPVRGTCGWNDPETSAGLVGCSGARKCRAGRDRRCTPVNSKLVV